MESDCKFVSETWFNTCGQRHYALYGNIVLPIATFNVIISNFRPSYHEQFISMDFMVIGPRRNSGLALCFREQGINQVLISGKMEQKRTCEENRTIEISSTENHTGYECTRLSLFMRSHYKCNAVQGL